MFVVSRYLDDDREMRAIDIVYTWVNGSDPKFLSSLKHTIGNLHRKGGNIDKDNSYFADNDQLR